MRLDLFTTISGYPHCKLKTYDLRISASSTIVATLQTSLRENHIETVSMHEKYTCTGS